MSTVWFMTPEDAVSTLARTVFLADRASETEREAIAVLQNHLGVTVDTDWGDVQIRHGVVYRDGKPYGVVLAR